MWVRFAFSLKLSLSWAEYQLSCCPVCIPSSEACVRLEARDALPPWQWPRNSQWPRLEHGLRGPRSGGESTGAVWAIRHFLQNSYRAHHHPRYHFHHLTSSIQHTTSSVHTGFHRDQKVYSTKVIEFSLWSDMDNLESLVLFIGVLFIRPRQRSTSFQEGRRTYGSQLFLQFKNLNGLACIHVQV